MWKWAKVGRGDGALPRKGLVAGKDWGVEVCGKPAMDSFKWGAAIPSEQQMIRELCQLLVVTQAEEGKAINSLEVCKIWNLLPRNCCIMDTQPFFDN